MSKPTPTGLFSHGLNPAASGLPCDLCGATNGEEIAKLDRDGAPLRTVICRGCGLVYSDPRPDPESVREYYQHSYRLDYKASFQPKPKHVFRAGRAAVDRVRRLGKALKPGCKILDVGAGAGETVYVLRKLGYDATGFEPNEGYAKFAAEILGLPVTHGFYQEAGIAEESVDVVTMYHVVEHFESPSGALRQAVGWLRPGGRLMVEVPNIEAVCQWPSNTFHRAHLYNFNPAAMEATGLKAGCKILKSEVSEDGGNLSVLFEKTGGLTSAVSGLPGNYERVKRILKAHTRATHALSLYPYVRPVKKLVGRWAEWRGTGKGSTREILDRLVTAEWPAMGW